MKKGTVAEAGAKGGKQTLKRYGRKHFRNLVNRRWKKEGKK